MAKKDVRKNGSVDGGLGLTEKTRKTMIDVLNRLLADEVLLYLKTRNFHWNVTGSDFGELHKFFEGQYEQLDEMLDEVAERARSLDGLAAGSMADFLRLTRLKEASSHHSAREMLAALRDDHEAIIRLLRVDIETAGGLGDAGTNDFLTGKLEEHEKMAWMLRAYLQ